MREAVRHLWVIRAQPQPHPEFLSVHNPNASLPHDQALQSIKPQ